MTAKSVELGVIAIGLAWPLLAQLPATPDSIKDWMQFGICAALVLIHTLWTIPSLLKRQDEKDKQWFDTWEKHQSTFKCHGKTP
jgi:hypothetical protein